MTTVLEGLKESLRKLAPTAIFDPEPSSQPIGEPGSPGSKGGGLTTGFGDLDRQLHAGGLPVGRLTEISGAPSSGKTALTLAALSRCAGLAAWVDGRDQLYPPAAAALGVDLERLLVVKPPVVDISRAAEILIRSRGFEMIAIDLPAQHRLARSVAHRLRTAAHQTRTALVVLCNRGGDVEAAHTRLEVRPGGSLSRPRTAVSVRKGSRSGDVASADIDLAAFRAAVDTGAPIAPVLERIAPGIDLIAQ
jgi:hypothetical protein